MDELADDNSTIFSGDLNSEERAAVKSGEKRGEHVAMKEDPKRFSLAGQKGKNIRKYEINYVRAFGHE